MIKFDIAAKLLTLGLIGVFYSSSGAQTATKVAKDTLPSVVMIRVQDTKGKPMKFGSGFFVKPDVLATNFHVISGGASAVVTQIGNSTVFQVDWIIGVDQENDLALLKVKGLSGRPLRLGNSKHVEIGEDVFVLGNPQGLEGTISTGILSARGLRQIGKENLLQITAPISSGSSGGPVVNARGEVIGIAVASLAKGQNLNFAVPVALLADLLDRPHQLLGFAEILSEQQDSPNSKPTFDETANWLTEVLKGRSHQYGNLKYTTMDLTFSGCEMTFVEGVQPARGERWRSQFKASLKDFVEIYEAAADSTNGSGGLLQLSLKPQTVLVYRSLDDSYRRINNIKIPISDSSLGERVVKASNHLSTFCKQSEKKEPF
jgi:S1-C subfamily serine protease